MTRTGKDAANPVGLTHPGDPWPTVTWEIANLRTRHETTPMVEAHGQKARVLTLGGPLAGNGTNPNCPAGGRPRTLLRAEREWDEPKLRFPPVLWLCLRGPAREEHSRTYHYLQEAARTAPGKNPEREKRGGGRHQGGPWAVPTGSGAAEAAGKTGAPLRGIRTASQRRSVGSPHAVIW